MGNKNQNADDILVKGSGKAYKKKSKEGSKAGKIITIIVSVLVVVIVAGVIVLYNVFSSGFVQKHTAAVESEHYTVTSSMMTYYFNTTYQNYVNQYSSYLQYMGLDTSKTLSEQTYTGDQTWYDQFMTTAKTNVQELLVLAEGANSEGMKLDEDDKAEIQKQLDDFDTNAKKYSVTTDYYISKIYGECVTKNDIKKCLELSALSAKYYKELTGGDDYSFTADDWQSYYEDNKTTFQKVDYLSYAFKVESASADTTATDAAAADNTAEKETLKGYAEALAQTTSADEFNAYIENYLRTVTYAGMDDAALEADKIDIQEKVDACKTTGGTYSDTNEFSKWAFDESRTAYEIYTTYDDTAGSYTVYMLLPAEDTTDLGLPCLYRETYKLVNYRYIPVLISDYNDDATAAEVAQSILDEYNGDATEDKFASLASADNYGDGNYEGGLLENADKGALKTEIDTWAFDSERKAGDTEIIHVDGTGYYVVYFSGTGDIKWEKTADNNLITAQYDKDYAEMSGEVKVVYKSKGLSLVEEVSLASGTTTPAATVAPSTTATAASTEGDTLAEAVTTAAE